MRPSAARRLAREPRIANAVLPEAFEQSHDAVGLSCTLGFLCAMVVKAVGFEVEHGAARLGFVNLTAAAH